MAPQSGKETRTQIRDRSLELKEQAEQGITDSWEYVDAMAADVGQRVEQLQARVTDMQEQSRARLEKQVGKVKGVAEKARARVAEVM